jgi:hypothetical protein
MPPPSMNLSRTPISCAGNAPVPLFFSAQGPSRITLAQVLDDVGALTEAIGAVYSRPLDNERSKLGSPRDLPEKRIRLARKEVLQFAMIVRLGTVQTRHPPKETSVERTQTSIDEREFTLQSDTVNHLCRRFAFRCRFIAITAGSVPYDGNRGASSATLRWRLKPAQA